MKIQQISKTLAGADRKELMRKLPNFLYDEEKEVEVRSRPSLFDLIFPLSLATMFELAFVVCFSICCSLVFGVAENACYFGKVMFQFLSTLLTTMMCQMVQILR